MFKLFVKPCQTNLFPLGGILKFTNRGRCWTIKIAYGKFLDWKPDRWKHVILSSLCIEIFIFEKYQNLSFLVDFQSFVVGQILADLGNFGQNLLHS
jgi:hypothetical protein